jgi:hypothetical protein
MSTNSDSFLGCLGRIVAAILTIFLVAFGIGWFSYDDELQKIKSQCIAEAPYPRLQSTSDHLGNQKFSLSPAVESYCTCVLDEAKQHLSRFEVAYAIAVNRRFDRTQFMQTTTMQNARKLCRKVNE